MIELKTPGEIDAMAAAGAVVAEALAATRAAVGPGVRLIELDQIAREVLRRAGASSPFLGYQPGFAQTPYPGVLCLSVNDAVLHGIPTREQLRDGDLLSVDCGATLDGWTGDAAISFCVGRASSEDARLLERTEVALAAGIAAAQPGARIGDISAAIGRVARDAGLGLHTDFGGHGVGRTMHESPSVPNDGRPGRGLRLQPGLTIAIEPWFLAGGRDAYRIDDDGWTIRSTDGSRGAHFEHSIAITEAGPRILTAAHAPTRFGHAQPG
ncbi:MAG TPA: type I methionyl aminopeptidase [Jatrophihabitantaceae bacterium]|nr:type I methionyl aminopeptidase [Jatrophihabitantaceae bacterium]